MRRPESLVSAKRSSDASCSAPTRFRRVTSDAYYGKALKVRRLIADDFASAYAKVDAILTPTSPSVAFKFGSKTDNPLAMYLCDVFTIPTNLAGHPAMSVPFGLGADSMPVGIQVLATTLGEQSMFKVAAELERAS